MKGRARKVEEGEPHGEEGNERKRKEGERNGGKSVKSSGRGAVKG